jgi:hypothetical protein
MYDVNPKRGDPLGLSTSSVKAVNTIYHNPQRPSCLVLPMRETAEKMRLKQQDVPQRDTIQAR